MPLRGTFAFVLAVTLLLPGVTPVSIGRSAGATELSSSGVANGAEANALEKEAALDEHELESNENDGDSNEAGLTPLDESVEYNVSFSSDREGTTSPPRDAGREETDGERVANPSLFPEHYDELDIGAAEDEIPAGLDGNDDMDPRTLEVIRYLAKRTADDNDEADEPEVEKIDEDDFSFSDLPQILGPLIQAFSGTTESEAPPVDDFLSWFPGLKSLLEPNKEEPGTAKPAALPTNHVTSPARRSVSPTSPELSLQIAPGLSSAQPEPPSPPSLWEELVTPVAPTFPAPPHTGQPSLSDTPDSEEVSY